MEVLHFAGRASTTPTTITERTSHSLAFQGTGADGTTVVGRREVHPDADGGATVRQHLDIRLAALVRARGATAAQEANTASAP